jgi:nicotinamidase-related amidase
MAQPVVVLTDVQERLFGAMDAERRDEMVRNLKILLPAARRLGVPVVVTEQYPKGLGRTLPELRVLMDDTPALEKTAFSACGAAGFAERLRELDAAPVIMTGIEAHVCVLMTALDLLARGVRVSIVADAVCSRRATSMDLGLAQARQAGAVVTSTETVVFQLLGGSDTEAFREISKLLR